MISIAKRVSFVMSSSSSSNSLSKFASDSSYRFRVSEKLAVLSRHLRLYKPSPSSEITDAKERMMEETTGKVVSQLGFVESTTPVAKQIVKFHHQPKRAAVLICLFEGEEGDFRVILTKRSTNLSTHSGEVSLPGGKAEEEDEDDSTTAMREAKEEIGLDPSLVNVVTVLEPFISKHLIRVTPVIGILSEKKAFRPVLNYDEVESIFDAPLEMFIKDENRRSEERNWMGVKYHVHYFNYETDNAKYLIWGLTASILIRAASVVYQRPASFAM